MTRERMPGATWLPLPEADDHGTYTKTQLIFHKTGTTAGARANRNYFAQAKVPVESTFIVDYDGEIVQVMNATARADANGSANRRAISVEMVGTGDEPLTPAQVASAIAIARWACDEHQISRRRIPTEAESGIGWHVMFGAPGPWTSVTGKVCPGTKAIQQIRDVVIPAATQPAALRLPPPPPAPTDEDDMFTLLETTDTKRLYSLSSARIDHIADMAQLVGLARVGAFRALDTAGNPTSRKVKQSDVDQAAAVLR